MRGGLVDNSKESVMMHTTLIIMCHLGTPTRTDVSIENNLKIMAYNGK